ncbi:hypothetical protein LTR08_001659 [Meristemomyces frigidus]|nr:hypothetical protein LTR08_001659 [Meristemomyces frigidus]
MSAPPTMAGPTVPHLTKDLVRAKLDLQYETTELKNAERRLAKLAKEKSKVISTALTTRGNVSFVTQQHEKKEMEAKWWMKYHGEKMKKEGARVEKLKGELRATMPPPPKRHALKETTNLRANALATKTTKTAVASEKAVKIAGARKGSKSKPASIIGQARANLAKFEQEGCVRLITKWRKKLDELEMESLLACDSPTTQQSTAKMAPALSTAESVHTRSTPAKKRKRDDDADTTTTSKRPDTVVSTARVATEMAQNTAEASGLSKAVNKG